nr:DUF547 domain-containing protein [Thalassotalea profundi]
MSFTSHAQNIHKGWNTLLSMHVVVSNDNHSTAVDYTGIKSKETELKAYLDLLTAITQAEFDGWGKAKQLAFLINAYNAWTVELIVSNLINDKGISLKSIKELGSFFSSPWSKKFIPLLGKTRSLDDIEHKLIRGSERYNDPRIHFAVNCASIGCPALREEAYTEDKLDVQLHAQTIRFLLDTRRNKIQGNTLSVSSIFKWYSGDFEKDFKGTKTVQQFFLHYSEALKLTQTQENLLKANKMKVKFLDYNWALNAL